jgi:hypothetical protein
VSDQCLQREAAQDAKTASGISVFLLEELGDARLRCAQLKKYIDEAVKLIDKSEHRDHFFEVAAHLMHGIPDTLMRMDKALSAAALAAAKLDYEEIKDDLQPEKVEELEKALEDVRIRRVQRRSTEGAVMNIKEASAQLERISAAMEASGKVDEGSLKTLIANLEGQTKEASGSEVPYILRELSASLLSAEARPSRLKLAAVLRRVLADCMDISKALVRRAGSLGPSGVEIHAIRRVTEQAVNLLFGAIEDTVKSNKSEAAALMDKYSLRETIFRHLVNAVNEYHDAVQKTASVTSQVAAGIYSTAGSREDVIKGFREANPNMTDEDLEKVADNWEKHKDVVKKQANEETSSHPPYVLHRELAEMKKLMSGHGYDPKDADSLQDEGMGSHELEHILKSTRPGGVGSLEYTHKIHKKQASTTSVADQAIRSRFEEGKPADPTENMDPEDSKKWKQQTSEHRDDFKAADTWKA